MVNNPTSTNKGRGGGGGGRGGRSPGAGNKSGGRGGRGRGGRGPSQDSSKTAKDSQKQKKATNEASQSSNSGPRQQQTVPKKTQPKSSPKNPTTSNAKDLSKATSPKASTTSTTKAPPPPPAPKAPTLSQRFDNALAVVQNTIRQTEHHLHSRSRNSDTQLPAIRKEFQDNKKKLKTDIKKCTAFVKKIKQGTPSSLKIDDILKDVAQLNLTRYVEEVAGALTDVSNKNTPTTIPKPTEIPVWVALVQAMHERYPDFISILVPGLWKIVHDNSDGNSKLRRVYVRFLTELWLCGLLGDDDPNYSQAKSFIKLIGKAAGVDESYATVHDPHLLVSFAKAATHEIIGTTPQTVQKAITEIQTIKDMKDSSEEINEEKIKEGDEALEKLAPLLQVRLIMEETQQERLLAHMKGAFDTLSASLVVTHTKLIKLEKRCSQDRLLSGTLPEAREKGLEDARSLRETLFKSTQSLSDILGEPMPLLNVEEKDDEDRDGGLEVWTKGNQDDDYWPFDDEDTKDFYCDVPDLLTTTPPALLGLSPDAIEQKQIENGKKYKFGNEEKEEVDTEADLPDVLDDSSVLDHQVEGEDMDGTYTLVKFHGMECFLLWVNFLIHCRRTR